MSERAQSAQSAQRERDTSPPSVFMGGKAATEKMRQIFGTPESIIKKYGNKSRAIRALSGEGYTRSEIAAALQLRYQHVRNVLQIPIVNSGRRAEDKDSDDTGGSAGGSAGSSVGTQREVHERTGRTKGN